MESGITEKGVALESLLRDRETIERILEGMRRVRPYFRKLFVLTSDLSDPEVVILAKLSESQNGTISVKEIFEALHPINPSKLTQVTNEMEERGLITKERDKKDRRRVNLILTSKGCEAYHALEGEMARLLARHFAKASSDELQLLLDSFEVWERVLGDL
jgi:DNA-binding MarR family transcriptional regulator